MGSRASQEQRGGRGSSLHQDPVLCPAPLALRPAAFAGVCCGQEVHKASGGSMCMSVTPGGWGGGGGGQGDLVLLWGELWVLQGANL